jgi:hypothetical protein
MSGLLLTTITPLNSPLATKVYDGYYDITDYVFVRYWGFVDHDDVTEL